MTTVANLRSPTHTAPGLTGEWYQASIRRGSRGGSAGFEVERTDQQPGGRDHADALNASQQTRRLGPHAVAQDLRDLSIQHRQMLFQFGDALVKMRTHRVNEEGPLE